VVISPPRMEATAGQRVHRTPDSQKSLQRYLAAGTWTAVGCALAMRGAFHLLNTSGGKTSLLIAMAAGLLKGRFIIDRVARQILARIRELGGNGPLLGFFSRRNWIMILSMILLGRLMRIFFVPPVFLWGVILAVGVALVFSSRLFWTAHLDGAPLGRPT